MSSHKRICAKIGGAQLGEASARQAFARSVRAARESGIEVVVVHGGGDQIRSLSKRLGIADRYHEGLRVTDAETSEVALSVLAGSVNKTLVATLQQEGVPAVGLCGADGATFSVQQHRPNGVDLGFVGVIDRIEPRLCKTLLADGVVPVLATMGPLSADAEGPRDHLYNVNADSAAAPLAAALGCDSLLFLTDVPAVLDADKQRIPSLDQATTDQLRADGVLHGGMLPKTEAALAAARHLGARGRGDGQVKIAPAGGDDALCEALADEVGTTFTL